MKLTPLAKIILILLVLGGAIGGYRALQNSKSGGTRVAGSGSTGSGSKGGGFSLPKIPGFGGGSNSGSNSNARSNDDSGQNTRADQNSDAELQFITSASKKGWIVEQIDKFNALPTTKMPVVLKSVETREAMHQILDGKAKPALWSPSSVIWADRLAEAYQGKTILDTGDNDSYRVILRTPLVFLTTKEKAKFLRPLLGTASCWKTSPRSATAK